MHKTIVKILMNTSIFLMLSLSLAKADIIIDGGLGGGNGEPKPILRVSPEKITFTPQLINTDSDVAFTVTISNIGEANSKLNINSITFEGDADQFFVSQINNCNAKTILASRSCTMSVRHRPTNNNIHSMNIVITTDLIVGVVKIPVEGTVVETLPNPQPTPQPNPNLTPTPTPTPGAEDSATTSNNGGGCSLIDDSSFHLNEIGLILGIFLLGFVRLNRFGKKYSK